MTWWGLANLVLVAHISLFVILVIGLVLAAGGWMRRHSRTSLVFWPALLVTVGWQALPACPLTELEYWLRWKQDAGWERGMSILRTVGETVTDVHPPPVLDLVFPSALVALAAYGFGRYHLRDATSAIRRAYRRSAGER